MLTADRWTLILTKVAGLLCNPCCINGRSASVTVTLTRLHAIIRHTKSNHKDKNVLIVCVLPHSITTTCLTLLHAFTRV